MTAGITATDKTFSVREMPWMGLMDGQVNVLPEFPSRAEAQALVHPWEPISEPLYRQVVFINDAGEPDTRFEPVPTVGNFRSDIPDAKGYLGPVSDTYVTVSNGEMWDVAEAIQNVPQGDVLYETGGSLYGGKKVWIAIRLAEPLVIKGDPHGLSIPFYILQNNHDGAGAFKGSATQIRPVCANTIRQADLDAQARGTEFTFRHSKNVAERVEQARAALAGWRDSLDAYSAMAEELLATKVDAHQEKTFIEQWIYAPEAQMTSDRVKRNIEEARGQWWEVYRSVTCEGITGTAWGLVQAASEYSEHVRRANNAVTRFRRAVLDPNKVLADAKEIALSV
jgi:phage/plasmid-like protein (TIGR03299 family)